MDTKEILTKYKSIAVVGFSDNKERDSYGITIYLKNNGYEVVGINPKLGGKEIDGIKCYAKLSDLEKKFDIVNIFRNSLALPGIVEECIKMNHPPDVVWAQLGISNQNAMQLAEENGFVYVENKCIYVEHKFNLKN